MIAHHFNGVVQLSTGRTVRAHLHESCAPIGTCVCGFCKGEGQCGFGGCTRPAASSAATLCTECGDIPWRAQLAGHRAA